MHVKALWSDLTTAESLALYLDTNVHRISCSLLFVAMQPVSVNPYHQAGCPKITNITVSRRSCLMEAVQAKGACYAGVYVVMR
jgi:hypothetical protein